MAVRKKTYDFLENFVLFMIILVLLQAFLEDFATINMWSWPARRSFILIGFFMDLFFTFEFFIRLFHAAQKNNVAHYMYVERGWVDLLASVPLLLLDSGPTLFAVANGTVVAATATGFLNVLKVVKSIRIARVLRLLRVLKILKKIKNTDSVMAQRHVAKIITQVITTVVIVLFVFSIIGIFSGSNVQEDQLLRRAQSLAREFEEGPRGGDAEAQLVDVSMDTFPELFLIMDDQRLVHARFTPEYLASHFGPSDYTVVDQGSLRLFISLREGQGEEAYENIRFFVIILAIVVMLTFVYSGHFAITVSDPLHVMAKGMNDELYNLEVTIPEEIKDDEVFKLARSYNEVYLPLKDRSEGVGKGGSALDISDFDDILKG